MPLSNVADSWASELLLPRKQAVVKKRPLVRSTETFGGPSTALLLGRASSDSDRSDEALGLVCGFELKPYLEQAR